MSIRTIYIYIYMLVFLVAALLVEIWVLERVLGATVD